MTKTNDEKTAVVIPTGNTQGTDVRNILLWLSSIEKRAASLYERAAAIFSSDAPLAKLLKELGEDERLHHSLVRRSAELTEPGGPDSVISMDGDSADRVVAPFDGLEALMDSGSITKDELLRYMVMFEFSELNGIFLYALDVLRTRSVDEVALVANSIEQHKGRILKYLSANPAHKDLLDMASSLPGVGAEKILVVDSKKVNAGILKAILETEGVIECAVSCGEALTKLEEACFSAVLVNLESDGLDAMAFYMEAALRYPHLKGRFLFLTATADSPEHASFLKRNKLPYLKRPAPVKVIRERVRKTLRAEGN